MKKIIWNHNLRHISFFTICFFILAGFSQIAFAVGDIYIAKMDDVTINPATNSYVNRCIKKAESNNAECLIIELDTPGGLLTSTRDIIKKMVNSKVPIVVYVAPKGARAGSAGFFITLASHIAVMAPMTNIGAAHPVDIGGGDKSTKDKNEEDSEESDFIDELKRVFSKDAPTTKTLSSDKDKQRKSKSVMEDKILNDTVAWVKTIANERGRNVDWAIEAVVNSASITEKEALEKKVIDLIASDINELLEKIDGKQIVINKETITLKTKNKKPVNIAFNFADKILNMIAHPNIAYILMLLGTLGLIFEVTHPGIGAPGIIGAICMILALFAFQALPVNFAGILLIILSIIFFIAEVKVVSYGLLTLAGIGCFFIGSIMLFDSPSPELQLSRSLIFMFTAIFCGALILVFTLVFKASMKKPMTGYSGIVGMKGKVETDLNPDGKVFVHGEIWNAKSHDGILIAKDSEVEVVSFEGFVLKVKKVG